MRAGEPLSSHSRYWRGNVQHAGQRPEGVGVEARVELRNTNSPWFSPGDQGQAGREASALSMRGCWGWYLMGWVFPEGREAAHRYWL